MVPMHASTEKKIERERDHSVKHTVMALDLFVYITCQLQENKKNKYIHHLPVNCPKKKG